MRNCNNNQWGVVTKTKDPVEKKRHLLWTFRLFILDKNSAKRLTP